jgi:putative transposase
MVIFAGWVNRRLQLQAVIEDLHAENEVRKLQLKGRLQLTGDERRKLAAERNALGRKLLSEVTGIVTPGTVLARHRRLVAAKGTLRCRTQGRLPLADEVRALILELARNDSNWGYRSIRDRRENLG